MYKFDNEKVNIASKWNDESIHILTDFDRTLTLGDSNSSWSILSKSSLMPSEYVNERDELYKYYRPIEIDESLDYEVKNKLMIEWWEKHISLFIKYKLSERIVNEVANKNNMEFRSGVIEFLNNMNKRRIPIIIISAGIGNFIEGLLKINNCYYDNIYIVSNFIEFEDGIAKGISKNIIHSLNKNEASIPDDIKKVISNRDNIILLGDQVPDVLMVSEPNRNKALKIGFINEKVENNLEYFKSEYDVVLDGKESFEDLKNIEVLSR